MATADGKKTGGRKKGVLNKDTLSIRDSFKKLIEDNLEQIKIDLLELKPEQRIKALTELSKFCVPTLKAVDVTDNAPKTEEKVIFEFVKR